MPLPTGGRGPTWGARRPVSGEHPAIGPGDSCPPPCLASGEWDRFSLAWLLRRGLSLSQRENQTGSSPCPLPLPARLEVSGPPPSPQPQGPEQVPPACAAASANTARPARGVRCRQVVHRFPEQLALAKGWEQTQEYLWVSQLRDCSPIPTQHPHMSSPSQGHTWQTEATWRAAPREEQCSL